MATVTASYNWVSGETVTPAKLNSTGAPTVVLADGEVTNAKLATGIDGAKVAPAFGAQDITVSTANRSITNTGNFALSFGTNNTERVRIDASGNVLVNTQSAGVSNGLSTTIETSGLDASRITVNHDSTGSTNNSNFMQFGYGGSLTGRISQSSTTSVAYLTTSDYRLKENVAPMTGALAKVAALKPCTFQWKSSGQQSQGFIAHELQEVCPEAVGGEKDAIDSDGKPTYQGVDASYLVATLVAAIQELTAKVEVLEAAQDR
jgi:hypothetical protein